ncbi:hypothetical protein [Cohnella thailandensis]|uniref:DUF3299 domain-containing protein n=1 Tax=Cohnella thailandensis TaxID=557557 RepID=A0A841SZ01_9BACL|nr:hypothetical protein [Cohnella thailandensis]MBB6634847.1 hypothetical protein [Cohnella thailandensis]MBP1975932.1 hypothetical protein [Cohnella thailandensis]
MKAKRRMKTAALAWLVAVMAVALVGCGERVNEPPMPETGQTNDAFVQESLAMGADDSKRRAAPEGEAVEQTSAQSSGQSAGTGGEIAPSAAPSDELAVAGAEASSEGSSGSGSSGVKDAGKMSEPGSGGTKAAASAKGDDGKGDNSKESGGKSADGKSGKPAAPAAAATPSPTPSPSSSASNPPKLASAAPEKAAAAASTPEASASPTPASPSPGPSPRPKKEKSGPETLTFSELYAEETVRGLKMSDKVNELNGQEVEMIGYMAPPLTATVRFFVLTKVAMSICPFCSSDADWPSDIVVVFMPSGKEIKPTEHEVKVTGTLSVGSQTDEETGFVSLIRINADKVEVLK